MNLYPVLNTFLCLCFLAAHGESPTHVTGGVSINCGSSGTSAAVNGREWLGDKQPKFSSLLEIKGLSSTTSTVIRKFISVNPVPHRTTRISRSKFSYEFQVSPSQKIIRLHFHPTLYRGFKGFKDLFTVESGPFTLLHNFSASLTAYALGVNSFVKEFCLNVAENRTLSISFSPSSFDANAFINGIQIISVPASLSYFHGGDVGVQVAGQKSPVYVDYDIALEIIYRLNIKKSSLPSARDLDDMFLMCAIRKIAESDDEIFKVFINGMIVHTNIDIVKERNGNNIPWYRDYMVMMRGNKKEGKRDLLISLQSYHELIDGHGLLAGFEIFKLSNHDNSLASPKHFPPAQDSPFLFSVLGHINVIATVAITVMALVNIIVHKSREIWKASIIEEENKPSARAKRFCRRFSLAEVKLATENFSDALLIGKGGFGRVYKGLIDKGQNTVAVKRLKPSSNQGLHEFLTEIEMLSELRHVNLVSLIGYCNEHGEMILVYEYMTCGTLADCLYKLQRESNTCSLTWKQRLDICIGVARGLDYLHTGHRIIHRDVKASNILLDENFVAKVSDFGLAKPEDRSKLKSYVSTKVKGTFGYLDPYYFNTHKLTRKSDTYAFGVVLLEVLCGRPAVDLRVAENERILSKWAQDNISKGLVDQIVASCLRGEMSPDSLKTFVEVIERCLCDEPKNRLTMSRVVLQLEFALEQQEKKQNMGLNEMSVVHDDIRACNNEIDLSVTKGKLTMTSQEEQNLTPPTNEQTKEKVVNIKLPTKGNYWRRATVGKPLRVWQCDGFWKKVIPSKKNKSLLYEVHEDLGEAGTNLARFDWYTVKAITNQFFYSNKIGHDGFGPVYKAVLPTRQLVAVKRLSPSGGQGLQEFKNEILLLPNLRHRNIVKLLGYCIHREEKILIYEFMENRLQDTIGDGVHRQHLWLQWSVRFNTIMGIARGLVYLHQDSGLKLIHKDLNSGNILLDSEMNPKISNFSFARTLVEHQSELETTVVRGTSGHIAPEYIRHGKFSVKTDVYSFGFIVMQIVCGSMRQRYELRSMFLPDYAWKLWNEGKALDLVDESLGGQYPTEEALRCIKIGLLCIQEQPHLRPTMPSVIKMLEGCELITQEPQEPRPLVWTEDSTISSVRTDEYWIGCNIRT